MRWILGWLAAAGAALGQTPANVLLVGHQSSEVSRHIGDYYAHRRAIPASNVCHLHVTDSEDVTWSVYEAQIELPIATFLKQGKLQEQILYIVTTLGVPLRV